MVTLITIKRINHQKNPAQENKAKKPVPNPSELEKMLSVFENAGTGISKLSNDGLLGFRETAGIISKSRHGLGQYPHIHSGTFILYDTSSSFKITSDFRYPSLSTKGEFIEKYSLRKWALKISKEDYASAQGTEFAIEENPSSKLYAVKKELLVPGQAREKYTQATSLWQPMSKEEALNSDLWLELFMGDHRTLESFAGFAFGQNKENMQICFEKIDNNQPLAYLLSLKISPEKQVSVHNTGYMHSRGYFIKI